MEVIWRPSEEVRERSNALRLARRLGFEDYWELVRFSAEEPERFWPAAIEDMGLEFSRPWERVVNLSRGPEWATWFVGGKLNLAWNCVHRWARGDRAGADAAVWQSEDGARRALSYSELSDAVTRFAEALAALGVEPGDRVALFLPMSPEVAIASHACAHLGAVQVPIFSGFAAPAIAARARAADEGAGRRGRRGVAVGRARRRLAAARSRRRADDARARRLLGQGGRGLARRAGAARGRLRAPLPPDLHLRDD